MKKIIIFLSILAITNNNKEYCDIKGNVKNPGVYEIKENYKIQDIIKLAGGLKKNSYTDNINLSKKVDDEMVIYIFNNNEIKQIQELNNCECLPVYKYIECDNPINETPIETTTTTTKTTSPIPKTTTTSKTTTITTNKKTTTQTQTTETTTSTANENNIININTASLNELLTIKGLGKTKAENIINYREINGNFNSIDELLNVNGIGQITFEKIKEFIKV